MIVVFSENGKTARLIAKYRPCAPVLLVTSNVKLARVSISILIESLLTIMNYSDPSFIQACSTLYSVYPMLLGKPISSTSEIQVHIDGALKYGVENGLCMAGKEVLVLTSTSVAGESPPPRPHEASTSFFLTFSPLSFHHQPPLQQLVTKQRPSSRER